MPTRRRRFTWDEVGCLDADHMGGWGAFSAGARETVDFYSDKQPALAFEMGFDESFTVFYQWRAVGHEPGFEFVRSRVCLDRRPCRYGGTRAYFICPACLRRTLRLAVLPEGLRCSDCGRVTWACRREQPIQRLIRQANKLATRLECDGWQSGPTKRPTNMRETTFVRLSAERAQLVATINSRIAVALARRGHFQQLGDLAKL